MTEASITATMSRTTARSPSAQSAGLPYLAISLAIAGLVVRGFWPSYFGPLIAGTATRPWFIHGHAAVYLVGGLCSLRVSFIAFGKVGHSIAASVAWALSIGALVFGVGFAVSIAAPALRVRSGVLPERIASLRWCSTTWWTYCASADSGRSADRSRQPEWHKRWILSATTALLGAAVGRMIQEPLVYRAVWLSPLVASMLIDLSRRQRVHLVSLISLSVLLVASFKVDIIAMSPVWAAVRAHALGAFSVKATARGRSSISRRSPAADGRTCHTRSGPRPYVLPRQRLAGAVDGSTRSDASGVSVACQILRAAV